MYEGETVFLQVMDFLPMHEFRKCIERYHGTYQAKSFSCLDQFMYMVFAQLTYRESLRDIEACLRSRQEKLYHLGIRGELPEAPSPRPMKKGMLYTGDEFGVELGQTASLDSTTIDLCLSIFPWATFRKTKAAIKMHILMDMRGSIPSFIEITDGKVHDVNIRDILIPKPGDG